MCAIFVLFLPCRYDNGTGEFIVPSGGAGLYYFFVHIHCDNDEEVRGDLRKNGVVVCRAYAGIRDESAVNEFHSASCGAVVALEEGLFLRKSITVTIMMNLLKSYRLMHARFMIFFFTNLFDFLRTVCGDCLAAPFSTSGDVIDVFVGWAPVDDTPIYDGANPHNSFSGFRIAPE